MTNHILLIEDSPTQALQTRLELEQHGFRVRIAGTGSGGLRLARVEHFDAILLDLDLPHMSGHDVCRFLKEDRYTQSIPVIVLTNHDDDERKRQSMALGAFAHVPKGHQAVQMILHLLQRLRLSAPQGEAAHTSDIGALPGSSPAMLSPASAAGQRPDRLASPHTKPVVAHNLHLPLQLPEEVGSSTTHLLAATLRLEPPTFRRWRLPGERAALPIGAYLLGYGYLRPRQLIDALREQQEIRARHRPMLLGDILIAQKIISPRVLATLAAVQLVDRLTSSAPFRPVHLGERLVVQGRLQPAQLAEAIQWQTWLRSRGTQVRLGEILVQRNLVTAREVEALLAYQDRLAQDGTLEPLAVK